MASSTSTAAGARGGCCRTSSRSLPGVGHGARRLPPVPARRHMGKSSRSAAGTGAMPGRQEAHALGRPRKDDRQQSVKTAELASRGGGPRLRRGQEDQGRKRHLCVDTLGPILAGVVHNVSVQDRDGGEDVLVALAGRFTRLRRSGPTWGTPASSSRLPVGPSGGWWRSSRSRCRAGSRCCPNAGSWSGRSAS